MRQKRALHDGYSLVELLIVLFIVVVMSIIPVKLLNRGDQRTMLRQHVREVVSELYRIRNVSASMNRPYRLSMNISGDDPDLFDTQVQFLDYTDNTWKSDNSVAKIDLERTILKSITDNGAPATYPLIFTFNSRGMQLNNAGNTPVLTPRTVAFSNEKTGGDIISITLNPLGGIRVTDNF